MPQTLTPAVGTRTQRPRGDFAPPTTRNLSRPSVNVGDTERWLSAVGGTVLGLAGLARGSADGLLLAAVGGGLVYRGVTGRCPMYQNLGLSTAEPQGPRASVAANQGVKVEQSFTVNRPREELFRFWRELENLPRFMHHLMSVKTTGGKRSHWVAKAPLGDTVAWDAEIINEKPNELIAWRSLEGADVDNAGSVHFKPAPGGRGTVVEITLKYDPPAGAVGATIAKLFGEEPAQQIREDLRRFKQLMEAGEIPTTRGQPAGQCC